MRIEKQRGCESSGYGESGSQATENEAPRPRNTAMRRFQITLLGLLCALPMGHFFYAPLPMASCALDMVYLAFVALGFCLVWTFIEDK